MVRSRAAALLESMPGRRTAESIRDLSGLMRDREQLIVERSARSLARIGTEAAFAALVEGLNSRDAVYWGGICSALRATGTRGVTAVLAVLETVPFERVFVIQKWLATAGAAIPASVEPWLALCEAVRSPVDRSGSLKRFGKKLIPPLLALHDPGRHPPPGLNLSRLNDRGGWYWLVADVLAELVDPRTVPALIRVLPHLTQFESIKTLAILSRTFRESAAAILTTDLIAITRLPIVESRGNRTPSVKGKLVPVEALQENLRIPHSRS